MSSYKIIVIGASHGGVAALKRIVSGLPSDLNAAVFVVGRTGGA
jgi:chemotaxis response regulator CheB